MSTLGDEAVKAARELCALVRTHTGADPVSVVVTLTEKQWGQFLHAVAPYRTTSLVSYTVGPVCFRQETKDGP